MGRQQKYQPRGSASNAHALHHAEARKRQEFLDILHKSHEFSDVHAFVQQKIVKPIADAQDASIPDRYIRETVSIMKPQLELLSKQQQPAEQSKTLLFVRNLLFSMTLIFKSSTFRTSLNDSQFLEQLIKQLLQVHSLITQRINTNSGNDEILNLGIDAKQEILRCFCGFAQSAPEDINEVTYTLLRDFILSEIQTSANASSSSNEERRKQFHVYRMLTIEFIRFLYSIQMESSLPDNIVTPEFSREVMKTLVSLLETAGDWPANDQLEMIELVGTIALSTLSHKRSYSAYESYMYLEQLASAAKESAEAVARTDNREKFIKDLPYATLQRTLLDRLNQNACMECVPISLALSCAAMTNYHNYLGVAKDSNELSSPLSDHDKQYMSELHAKLVKEMIGPILASAVSLSKKCDKQSQSDMRTCIKALRKVFQYCDRTILLGNGDDAQETAAFLQSIYQSLSNIWANTKEMNRPTVINRNRMALTKCLSAFMQFCGPNFHSKVVIPRSETRAANVDDNNNDAIANDFLDGLASELQDAQLLSEYILCTCNSFWVKTLLITEAERQLQLQQQLTSEQEIRYLEDILSKTVPEKMLRALKKATRWNEDSMKKKKNAIKGVVESVGRIALATGPVLNKDNKSLFDPYYLDTMRILKFFLMHEEQYMLLAIGIESVECLTNVLLGLKNDLCIDQHFSDMVKILVKILRDALKKKNAEFGIDDEDEKAGNKKDKADGDKQDDDEEIEETSDDEEEADEEEFDFELDMSIYQLFDELLSPENPFLPKLNQSGLERTMNRLLGYCYSALSTEIMFETDSFEREEQSKLALNLLRRIPSLTASTDAEKNQHNLVDFVTSHLFAIHAAVADDDEPQTKQYTKLRVDDEETCEEIGEEYDQVKPFCEALDAFFREFIHNNPTNLQMLARDFVTVATPAAAAVSSNKKKKGKKQQQPQVQLSEEERERQQNRTLLDRVLKMLTRQQQFAKEWQRYHNQQKQKSAAASSSNNNNEPTTAATTKVESGNGGATLSINHDETIANLQKLINAATAAATTTATATTTTATATATTTSAQ